MKCDDIQPLLFDYMSRELGDARSALVREHLRKCSDCRQAAAEIQSTLDVLRADSGSGSGMATSLSEERRRRMLWAASHPVLDWVYVHHVVVSVAIALVVLLLLSVVLRHARMFRQVPQSGPTIMMFDDGTWGVRPPDATNHVDGARSNDVEAREP
jgi:predicted anti-sigma-YlaC factor YlaD